MKPKAYERADCDYCGGLITYHEDDPENPWKHFDPMDSLRCARIRTQYEKTTPQATPPNTSDGTGA